MGPELAMAMMAGGTLMQMQAAEDQKDERRRVLNRQLERDADSTKKAIGLVQQEGGQYELPKRLEAMQQQEGETYDQIKADMEGAGGAIVQTASDAGNVSEDFLKTKAARAVDEGTRMTSVAREAAKARAPGQMLSNDALRRAGMSGNLQNIWGTNRNMAEATKNDANGVEAPAYGNLGALASAIGTSAAMSAYGQPGAKMPGRLYSGSPAPAAGINFNFAQA